MTMTRIIILLALMLTATAALPQETPEELREQWKQLETGDIPLNQSSPAKNMWRTLREDLNEGREPGLINVQRLVGHYAYVGISTFYKLPVALTPRDLDAANVEVAIMGA